MRSMSADVNIIIYNFQAGGQNCSLILHIMMELLGGFEEADLDQTIGSLCGAGGSLGAEYHRAAARGRQDGGRAAVHAALPPAGLHAQGGQPQA